MWRVFVIIAGICGGLPAFAGSGTGSVNPYALPTVYPNYPEDSTFKSMLPKYQPYVATPTPTQPVPIQVPVPARQAPAPAVQSVPQAGSLYQTGSGGAPPAARPGSGGYTGFSSNDPPILDPATVPKELVFGPSGASASPSPSPSPQPAEPASN
jgi:hypothetical protein